MICHTFIVSYFTCPHVPYISPQVFNLSRGTDGRHKCLTYILLQQVLHVPLFQGPLVRLQKDSIRKRNEMGSQNFDDVAHPRNCISSGWIYVLLYEMSGV